MKIEARKVVTLEYDLYVDGEELMEKATAEAPLVYCHGEGVLTLDKKMFYNGDGEFDSERVYVGAIVPMNTADGQVINAQIA